MYFYLPIAHVIGSGVLGGWWFGNSPSSPDSNFLRVANAFPNRRLSDNTLMTPKIRIAPSCASSPGGTPGGGGLPIRRHSSIGPQERRGSAINLSPPTVSEPFVSTLLCTIYIYRTIFRKLFSYQNNLLETFYLVLSISLSLLLYISFLPPLLLFIESIEQIFNNNRKNFWKIYIHKYITIYLYNTFIRFIKYTYLYIYT